MIHGQAVQPQGFDGCCAICVSFFEKVYFRFHFNTLECIITRGDLVSKKEAQTTQTKIATFPPISDSGAY